MAVYIFRRLVQSVIVLVILSIIVFMGMRLLPGDPILLVFADESRVTEERIAELRAEYGLDKPLVVQYFNWVGGVLQGDLGDSIHSTRSVSEEIARRLPVSLMLGIPALIISICFGVTAGVICAVRRGRWVDTVVTMLANFGITVPVFWLGIMLIYIFGLFLGWLPIHGYTSPFEDFGMCIKQLIMPVFCLTVIPLASIARQTRSTMLEVMHQDYIRTAWAKGINERVLITRHALKNGLIPIVTLIGVQTPHIVGGSIFVESVFNIPGMGRLAVASVFNQDYAVTQGVILTIAIAVILTNLLVDISYGWLNPRVRFQ